MPRIVCRTCGREVYATAPVEHLFDEERRCPRCGAQLQADRRADDRRVANRRANPPAAPGAPDGAEHRAKERRREQRRRKEGGNTRRADGWLE